MLARGVSGTHLTASHKGGFDERPGESICVYLMRTDRDKCTIVVLEAHTQFCQQEKQEQHRGFFTSVKYHTKHIMTKHFL